MIKHWAYHVLEAVTWDRKELSPRVEAGLTKMVDIIANKSDHVYRENELADIAEKLMVAANLSDINELLWKAATLSGFKHASLVSLSGRSLIGKFNACTSYSKEWIIAMASQRQFTADPIIQELLNGRDAFYFSDIRKSDNANESYWLERDRYRLGRNGFALGITTTNQAKRIGAIFCSDRPEETTRAIVEENGSDLREVARLAAETFATLSRIKSQEKESLNNVELEFLQTLALSDDPKSALNFTPVFGSKRSIQSTIKKKLGVNTIFQAVVVAAENGWLLPNKLDTMNTHVLFQELDGWDIVGKLEENSCPAPQIRAG